MPKPVSEFYNLYKRDAGRLQADELLGVLRKVLVEFDQCFVAIDALDELDGKKHRKGFLKLLTDLGLTSTKIFVTSRPHLQDVTQTFPRASKIFVEASEVDVELFLSRMIEDDEGMQDLMDEALKKEVCSSIAQYAKGMYVMTHPITRVNEAETMCIGSCCLSYKFNPYLIRLRSQGYGNHSAISLAASTKYFRNLSRGSRSNVKASSR